jgi:hypothetical protein
MKQTNVTLAKIIIHIFVWEEMSKERGEGRRYQANIPLGLPSARRNERHT